MIWLTTLLLLAIAAWLFMNALSEKQWVDAHSHDESVARDQGLFASFSGNTRSSIADVQNSDTAARLRTKTQELGARVKSEVQDDDGLLHRVKDNVTAGVEKVSKKVDSKLAERKAR